METSEMKKLRDAFVIALAAVKTENAELEHKLEVAVHQREVLGTTLRVIKEEKDKLHKDIITLQEKMDKREKELQEKETAINEKYAHIISLQEKFQEQSRCELEQSESLEKETELRKSAQLKKDLKRRDREILCYQQLADCKQQLIDCKQELADCRLVLADCRLVLADERKNQYDKLLNKTEELHTVENKLRENIHVTENLRNKLEMVILRKALITFEETVVGINKNNKKARGELWDCFFNENEQANQFLNDFGFKGSVKDTVLNIFLKLNYAVHSIYPLDHEMIIQEKNFEPNERKLIKAVWALSPLKQGSLEIYNKKEESKSCSLFD